MDTTETENRQGSRDKAPADNVVRLPRDWLGPREDLVPFGPAAYRGKSDAVTELPRNADDFWGGADGQETVESDTSPEATRPPRRRPVPRLRGISRPRLHVGFPVPRLRLRTALLLGLGLLGILAVVGFMMGSGARKPSSPGLRADTSTRSQATAPGLDAGATGLRDTAAQHAAHARARHAAAVRHRAELRRQRANTRRREHHHRGSATPVQAIEYTPVPVASSGTGVSSSTGSVSTGASASSGGSGAASSPSASAASTPSTASSASTGGQSSSSNQPATGANGSLGPGSSPDG